MKIRECYEKIHSDYDKLLLRLMNEKMIYKFCKKFAASEEYDNLVQALKEKDYESAFRMSHNIKGMCLNLEFTELFQVSSALCEELRGGQPQADVMEMLDQVTVKYREVLAVIDEMEEP